MTNAVKTIAIIGGGFCGVTTAINLIRYNEAPLRILIINDGYPLAKGVAYSTYSKKHLLNVPAGKMSAFVDDENSFVDWLKQREPYSSVDSDLLSKTFIPRYLYGQYLNDLWTKCLSENNDQTQIEIICDRVISISGNSQNYSLRLNNRLDYIKADFIVLATGNSVPRNPGSANEDFYNSSKYFVNPWLESSVDGMDNEQDVLIIGNGLTMVDTVIGLLEKGFRKTIYSVSPNGFAILSHRHGGLAYRQLEADLKEPYQLNQVYSTVKKHIKKVRALGISAEPVIDALRPYTQKIWRAISTTEKEEFMAHLRHVWGVARHRIPIQIHDRIQNLRLQNRLIVYAGRIQSIIKIDNSIAVTFKHRSTGKSESIIVGRIINCTGPESDITKSENSLLRNLAASGLIKPDALKLGIDADANTGAVINRKANVSETMYTIGGNLKGVLWESTAVPELRVQADRLAKLLLTQVEKANEVPLQNDLSQNEKVISELLTS